MPHLYTDILIYREKHIVFGYAALSSSRGVNSSPNCLKFSFSSLRNSLDQNMMAMDGKFSQGEIF